MNQSTTDFESFHLYAKSLTGFTEQDEKVLHAVADRIEPYLDQVTDEFYCQLMQVPETGHFLQGRVDHLKTTHRAWLGQVFNADFDWQYCQQQYQIGFVHVQVKLPIEFMSAGMCLMQNCLIDRVTDLWPDDAKKSAEIIHAINAVFGYSLLTMQHSYQLVSLEEELDKFLAITGISRKLFGKLASAFSKY